MTPVHGATDGDVDVDATLARTDGLAPMTMDDVVVRRWGATERAICLLVDRSGSMNGRQVAPAALAAASVVVPAERMPVSTGVAAILRF